MRGRTDEMKGAGGRGLALYRIQLILGADYGQPLSFYQPSHSRFIGEDDFYRALITLISQLMKDLFEALLWDFKSRQL